MKSRFYKKPNARSKVTSAVSSISKLPCPLRCSLQIAKYWLRRQRSSACTGHASAPQPSHLPSIPRLPWAEIHSPISTAAAQSKCALRTTFAPAAMIARFRPTAPRVIGRQLHAAHCSLRSCVPIPQQRLRRKRCSLSWTPHPSRMRRASSLGRAISSNATRYVAHHHSPHSSMVPFEVQPVSRASFSPALSLPRYNLMCSAA